MKYVVTGGMGFIGLKLLFRFIEMQKTHVKATSSDAKKQEK